MNKNKMPSAVLILILTLVTVILWVLFSIYRAITVKPAPTIPDQVSATLNPTLDQNSIYRIESNIFFNDSQVPDNILTAPTPGSQQVMTVPIPTPTPAATPAESASPSAIPSPSP
jgi:cytoskeletal protein RodZ